MTKAFDPYNLSGTTLKNHIVMAPMTRSRAFGPGSSPTPLMATYYAQRASAGLIITEGTQPSVVGQGYPDTPGLHSVEQIDAWKIVTDAVHARGGIIFAQLMHTGRIGDPDLLPGNMIPVAPSPVQPKGNIYTHSGLKSYVTPHALTADEVLETIQDFVKSARNAIKSGFDGVEIHAANGYLLHQFLATNTNQRTDDWGGSAAKRTRFTVAVATAVAEAIGAHHTGIRLSPGNTLGDIEELDLEHTYELLINQLAKLNLAYVHIKESTGKRYLTRKIRNEWPGTMILNPTTTPHPTGAKELQLIDDGLTDLVSFGAMFIANPDLPERLKTGGQFNTHNRDSNFGGDHQGYTDYPALLP